MTVNDLWHVWWPWLTSKCVARVCQHQLSFLFNLSYLQIDTNYERENVSRRFASFLPTTFSLQFEVASWSSLVSELTFVVVSAIYREFGGGHGLKMQDWKVMDQIIRLETTGSGEKPSCRDVFSRDLVVLLVLSFGPSFSKPAFSIACRVRAPSIVVSLFISCPLTTRVYSRHALGLNNLPYEIQYFCCNCYRNDQ